MAYDPNYLTMFFNGGGGGPVNMKLWLYDTADASATIDTSGYITDGKAKGMEKGDMVWVRKWTTAPPTTLAERQTAAGTANILLGFGYHVVMGISTTGTVDLADVTAGTVTNTD